MLAEERPYPEKQTEPKGGENVDLSFRRAARAVPFLACLSENEFREMEAVVVKREFKKNEMILSEDEALDFFYLVYSGKVKVVKTSGEGKEHILAVRGRGEFFGEMGFLDGKTEPAAVTALEPCKVALIRKFDFDRLLMSNKKALRELIFMLSERLREAWLNLSILRESSAENRVRAYLASMAKRFGIQDSRGVLINLRITHKQLADCTCLSRETVSRNIRKLVESHEIERALGKFILSKNNFKKIV